MSAPLPQEDPSSPTGQASSNIHPLEYLQQQQLLPPGSAPNPKNPACDHCREKKVRCSREKPTCQNCRSSRAQCLYSEPLKRPPDVLRNVHRFEEVNTRLDRIEAAIANLTQLFLMRSGESCPVCSKPSSETADSCVDEIPTRSQQHTTTTTTTTTTVLSSSNTAPLINSAATAAVPKQFATDALGTPQYLGSSSILSLTSEAQKLAEEKLISADLLPRKLLDRAGASRSSDQGDLENLSQTSATLASAIPSYGHHLIREGAAQVKQHIPWKAEALEMVDEFFKSIYHWYPVLDEETFRKDLDKMYSDPETMTKDGAWMAVFNNILLFGLHGKMMNATGEERKIIDLYATQRTHVCFFNAWTALDDLETFMTPCLRNVQALFTMSLCAIELGRPALCWGLLSQAARSAQALGLHRRATPQAASRVQVEERKALFWCIYILDKRMSLIFGRSACLPEFDCDVELPVDNGTNPYFKNFLAEIALAQIQSSIYIRLYSAQAGAQSQHDLEVAILELDREVDTWWEEWGDTTDYDPDKGPPRAVNYYQHVQLKFAYYSSVTLINRMVRPGMAQYAQGERKALESARAAIKMTMDVVDSASGLGSTGLLLWLFNCHPFTSFFLLFSNIIRYPAAPSSTETDLPLMQALVEYLDGMQERNYESAARLLSVAVAFTNVAITFLRNYRRQMRKRRVEVGSSRVGDNRGPQKRHRVEEDEEGGATEDNLPPLYPPTNARITFQLRDVVPIGGYGSTVCFQPPAPAPPAPPAPSAPPPSAEEVNVDLQTAAFLRWPEAMTGGLVPEFGDAVNTSGSGSKSESGDVEVEVDMETLMTEPLGFQMKMEQAALRGAVDFDWFGWETHFGGEEWGGGGGSGAGTGAFWEM